MSVLFLLLFLFLFLLLFLASLPIGPRPQSGAKWPSARGAHQLAE
ncbi:hypothetical protein ACFRMN_12800 [Streptomyces sp. NPDC056835]